MSRVNSDTKTVSRHSHINDQLSSDRLPGDDLKMFIDEKDVNSGSGPGSGDNSKRTTRDQYFRWAKLGLIFVAVTGYYIASMVLTPRDPLIRTLLFVFIISKLFFEILPSRNFTAPIVAIIKPATRLAKSAPRLFNRIAGVIVALICILSITFGAPVTENGTTGQRCQSLLGLVVFILLMVVTSRNIRRINWQPVISGILIQVLLGVFVIKTEAGRSLFQWISGQASSLITFAKAGSSFVFGDMANTPNFAFTVLPGILFFASFIQILYYLGTMQWVIIKFAWFFKFLMDTSGCESVVAAASPFVGMGESALLVKPFLIDMTQSELHQVMASGFATIAGSVLIAFLNMGINPTALITSCVMSIPCSLALSKLRYPEVEESKTKGTVIIPESEDKESNILHAAANGAAQGVTLCLLVAGTLLAITSLMFLVDSILTWLGSYLLFEELTLRSITKYFFMPFAWLIGIPWKEAGIVGELMAVKMFVNEFKAFADLADIAKLGPTVLSERSRILTTYSLCGFANFASIGIQVGCLGAMVPSRKPDLARLAMSAMVTGTMCTFVSATIAGLLI